MLFIAEMHRVRSNSSKSYTKTVTLMTNPAERKVRKGNDKLNLYLNKHTFNSVDVPLNSSAEELKLFFSDLFQEVLEGAR